jgi:pilus assembly protein CpaC
MQNLPAALAASAVLCTGAAHAVGALDANLPARNCASVSVAPTTFVMLGKSTVIPLGAPVARIVVSGQPAGQKPPSAAPMAPGAIAAPAASADVAENSGVGDMEVLLLSPTDLFFRGKRAGVMNVILQDAKAPALCATSWLPSIRPPCRPSSPS